MKVKELIEQLQKYDSEQDVIIRFALDKDDEIGYVLETFNTGLYFKEECAIYAEYTATKEDCDWIGQVDLKEAYQKMKQAQQKKDKYLKKEVMLCKKQKYGEYVRYEGKIYKIIEKQKYDYNYKRYYIKIKNVIEKEVFVDVIEKHSKNIIDLIEERRLLKRTINRKNT